MVTHVRPPFGIDPVDIDDCPVSVTEKAAYATPFATLLRFKKETGAAQSRVLLVAPMSGHFATLLRATARTMLVDHDVYITDWHNARDVPVAEGRFDFSDFVDHVIKPLSNAGTDWPSDGHLLPIRFASRAPGTSSRIALDLIVGLSYPAGLRFGHRGSRVAGE